MRASARMVTTGSGIFLQGKTRLGLPGDNCLGAAPPSLYIDRNPSKKRPILSRLTKADHAQTLGGSHPFFAHIVAGSL